MFALLRASVVLFVLLSAITGLAYPALVTVLAAAFPHAANGSVTTENGATYSDLLGQPFTSPKYFWSRPSGTSPQPYNGASSGASNQGPTNPDLAKAVKERIEALRAADPENKAPVPVDLVTASGSGLDPHISPAAAEYQSARVAKARGMSVDAVRAVVARYTEGRTFGVLGEPRVHVVKLNLALEAASKKP